MNSAFTARYPQVSEAAPPITNCLTTIKGRSAIFNVPVKPYSLYYLTYLTYII